MEVSYYIGIELNEKEVRLCVYNRAKKDADTVMIKAGGSRAESPAHMTYIEESGQWKFGIEADYFAGSKNGVFFDDILQHLMAGRDFLVNGKSYSCEIVFAMLIREVLKFAGVKEPTKQVDVLTVTTPDVNKQLARTAEKAFSLIGFQSDQAYIQDFDESFYAHAFFQRPDAFSREVGLFYFKDESEVCYKRMHIDHSTKPATVTMCDEEYTALCGDDNEKDRQFEEFIIENTSKHEYSSFFLVGKGFDRKWAENSLTLLGKAQRKVFYGNNLFAKGACYTAYEKRYPNRLKNTVFLGKNLVRKNIGIEMTVDGIEMYYPLITAGINWYDAENSCELLLNGIDSIVFRTSRLESGERANYSMPLEGLPERPPKTTRLKVELHFENVEKCAVTVTDLGFGELFPSSKKAWTDRL